MHTFRRLLLIARIARGGIARGGGAPSLRRLDEWAVDQAAIWATSVIDHLGVVPGDPRRRPESHLSPHRPTMAPTIRAAASGDTALRGAGADVACAVVVDFPLRGEGWVAVTSPADRVPSHGTNLLGQRFAFDLLKVDDRQRLHDHPAGTLRGLLVGRRTQSSYAWGAPVHAPFDAEIVRAVDGTAERRWLHPVRELALMLWNGLTFTPSRLPSILGNHVIARSGSIFAGFAHLAPGSVAVAEGQSVRAGQVIGRVGDTGNSTAPHLHFQLMDSADPLTARGVPCAFRSYDVLSDGAWVGVENGIPGRRDRIRADDPGPRIENL